MNQDEHRRCAPRDDEADDIATLRRFLRHPLSTEDPDMVRQRLAVLLEIGARVVKSEEDTDDPR